MKTVEINGMIFEVRKSRMHPITPIIGCNIAEIYDAYDRPSAIKIKIWNDWCMWCTDINNLANIQCGIQIESHNCFSFTINGSLRVDNKVYELYITKNHNILFKH